jgi:hypothetical protein
MKSIPVYLKISLVPVIILMLLSEISAQDKEGNPIPQFLFPSFKEGIVIMKDGKKISGLLNYNMAEEKMVSEVEGVYRYSKDPKYIQTIFLENRVFVPVESAFYEVLSTGQATFFLQHKCYVASKGTDVGYGASSQSQGPTKMTRVELVNIVYQYGDVAYLNLPPDVNVTPASAFWVRKGEKLERFNTQKQLLKIFPEQASELKTFMKNENIKVKSREDVIKLGDFCNKLLENGGSKKNSDNGGK